MSRLLAAIAARVGDRTALAWIDAIATTRPNLGRAGQDAFEFRVPTTDPEDLADGVAEWTWYVGIDLADS